MKKIVQTVHTCLEEKRLGREARMEGLKVISGPQCAPQLDGVEPARGDCSCGGGQNYWRHCRGENYNFLVRQGRRGGGSLD